MPRFEVRITAVIEFEADSLEDAEREAQDSCREMERGNALVTVESVSEIAN